jgi:hypothetical protein
VPDGSTAGIGNITLPGRNFSGYGQPVDQSLLSMLENFASATGGPTQPITGQLWYDTSVSVMKYNISDTATANWAIVPSVSSDGNLTLGNLTLTGNLVVNAPGVISGNGSGLNSLNASNLSTGTVPVARLSGTYNINIIGNVAGNLVSNTLTTGSSVLPGTITGQWAMSAGSTLAATTAGTVTTAAQPNITSVGTLTSLTTRVITTGANITTGTMTGNWTLTAGSKLNATYADLAERHHADGVYSRGTVMKVGGNNEVTAASVGDQVLGVVSTEYAYLMNSEAGTAETHPAVAYVGRVPVRIMGPITKHESIVPTLNGCARAARAEHGFGWALETNADEGEKLVLCIIK